MIRLTVWILCLVGWTVLLLWPSSDIPSVQLASGWDITIFIAKTVHVSIYAALTFFAGWFAVPGRYRWILVFVIMAHGTVTELLQLATFEILGRSGLLTDVGLDNLGVLIGLLAGWKWWTSTSAST